MSNFKAVYHGVCVIIPTLNGGDFLAVAVSSCVENGVFEKDIVIVDNGSSDNSVVDVKIAFPEVVVVINSCNKGFSVAVNQGLACCVQDIILILNNDAELRSGAVEALRDCFNKFPDAAIIGARLLRPSGKRQNSVASFPSVWREIMPGIVKKFGSFVGKEGQMQAVQKPTKVPSVIGAAMAVRRASLDVMGMLDEEFFFYFEETEWCYRAWQRGFSVIFCPDAEVIHALGKTANKFRAESRIEYHRSRLIFARKVEGRAAYLFLLFFLPFRTGINFLSNALVALLSLGAAKRQSQRMRVYGTVFVWHLLGRPKSWGLPNKCPRNRISTRL